MGASTFIAGAVAGLIATVPMTAAMEAMHSQLPPHEQYPLPPSEITSRIEEEAGVEERVDEDAHRGLTLAMHFGYGAATGALYAPLAKKLRLPPLLGGAGFGLAIWTGSYLGLLPALGILRPATEHPPRRNALMIAAHLVWGSALGVLVEVFQKDGEAN